MTYPATENVLIAGAAEELGVVFIDAGGVERFAALSALDTLLVEWFPVQSHHRLCRIHGAAACRTLGSCRRCCPTHGSLLTVHNNV